MEERGHTEARRGVPELTNMVGIDFDRLAGFRYAIVTTVSSEGYPWSIPTEFEVTSKHEILLRKPIWANAFTGKRVGVLFNHIAAIPSGGYTERRYILVWGKLTESGDKLKLTPEEVSEWDEKILPFAQLCAKSAPQGQKYLEKLSGQIAA